MGVLSTPNKVVSPPVKTGSQKSTPAGSQRTTPRPPAGAPTAQATKPNSITTEAKKNLHRDHGDHDSIQEKHVGRSTNNLIANKYQANLAKSESRKAKNLFPTQPATRYEAIAKEYDEWSKAYLAKAGTWPSLLSRFGVAVAAQTDAKKIDKKSEVVLKWDKDGNGVISLMEFRNQVKNLHLGEKDYKEIDQLFTGFDNVREPSAAPTPCPRSEMSDAPECLSGASTVAIPPHTTRCFPHPRPMEHAPSTLPRPTPLLTWSAAWLFTLTQRLASRTQDQWSTHPQPCLDPCPC